MEKYILKIENHYRMTVVTGPATAAWFDTYLKELKDNQFNSESNKGEYVVVSVLDRFTNK